MQLEILTPEFKLFKGEVQHIEMPGTNGSFGVLNNHAPMISSLGNGQLRFQPNSKNAELVGQEKLFQQEGDDLILQIKGGFAEVLNNKVSVLIESL